MPRLFNCYTAAALLRQDDPEHPGIPFGADAFAFDRMLEVEGVFDFAGGSGKAYDEAPIADFDGHRAGFGAGRGNLGFVVRAAVDHQRAIERMPPILAPPRDQQVLEKLVEGTCEIVDPEGAAALWRS